MANLSYAEVSLLIKPDFADGKLYWLPRTPDMFSVGKLTAEHSCNLWNSKHAGKQIYSGLDYEGYCRVLMLGKVYKAHRVMWLLAYGEWPEDQIDHINGVRSDNRLVNLRAASNLENGRNQRRSSRNKSGVTGVSWDARAGKWLACIRAGGRNKFLGHFSSLEMAADARKSAEAENGFHPNHGKDS